MTSDELVKMLYQIGDSFNKTSIWTTIILTGGLMVLGIFVFSYARLELWERKTIQKINNQTKQYKPTKYIVISDFGKKLRVFEEAENN